VKEMSVGDDGEEEVCEEEEPVKVDPQTHSEDMWLDFQEFCKCFKCVSSYI
jgi:hypothetical protein